MIRIIMIYYFLFNFNLKYPKFNFNKVRIFSCPIPFSKEITPSSVKFSNLNMKKNKIVCKKKNRNYLWSVFIKYFKLKYLRSRFNEVRFFKYPIHVPNETAPY
jgi:hypothetical protein